MGFDGPDEDDAPTAARRDSPTTARRDSPTAERDPVPVDDLGDDSDEARAAYNIEYRALVDAEYAAAPDSWTAAVPALRRTWEEHEKQYPRPERSGPTPHPDGSWHGDGDVELNPTRNAEATDACAEIREQARDEVLPAMRRVEAEDVERRLVGLEHWLKGEDRIKEKIAERLRLEPELPMGQALAGVPDAVRFTFAYSETRYVAGVRADVERLKADGFELIKLKNSWASDQYKGINTQWRLQDSELRVEVQFHTPTSFAAKQLTHKAYERLRSPLTSVGEEQALMSFQREACAKIPEVPGADEIEDYRPEKRDG